MSSEKAKQGARPSPEYLAVGRIVRPHGLRGGLVVESLGELLAGLTKGDSVLLGEEHLEGVVEYVRPHQSRYLVGLRDVHDRTESEALRGLDIYIPLDRAKPLDDRTYYHWQIVGVEVETMGGRALGRVSEIIETGANDVYVVQEESGREHLIPAIESVIVTVDVEAGKMVIRPMPGLLE